MLTSEDLNRTIAVDMDGVVIEFDEIWRGMEYLGKPISGAAEALRKLRSGGWRVVIYTSRLNPESYDASLVPYYHALFMAHLLKHGIEFDELTGMKPCARYYIDDRAIRFFSWPDAMTTLEMLENCRVAREGGNGKRKEGDVDSVATVVETSKNSKASVLGRREKGL